MELCVSPSLFPAVLISLFLIGTLAQHRQDNIALPRPAPALVGAAEVVDEALQYGLQITERNWQ